MWEDLFSSDTWNTIQQGLGTAGSAFNSLAPIINRGAQLAAGIEGTRRAGQLAAARGGAQQSLDQLFTPGGEYAQELRKQLERRDAAAGRRSQYGTRETELMAKLAQQRASVLTNPQYAAYLTGAQQSPYGPLAGAVGSLTGGQQQGGSKLPNTPPGTSNALNYLYDTLFAPAADASIAAGLGGAGEALGAGGLGNVGMFGAEGLSGTTGLLPGYAEAGGPQASGLFGDASLGALTGAGDLAAAGLGGAGSALSGLGAGSLAGTVGGVDALGGILGGTGFLPGYAGTAGASGLFGGGVGAGTAGYGAGAAGAGAAGAGGGAAGGGASAGLGGLGAAAGVALPAAVLLGGLLSMFQEGTQPKDISGSWAANQGGLNQQNFNQFAADDPTLNALLSMSKNQSGGFDQGMFNQALANTTIGGKRFEGEALQQAQNFGQHLAQNPGLFGGPAATEEAWWSPYAQGTPSN